VDEAWAQVGLKAWDFCMRRNTTLQPSKMTIKCAAINLEAWLGERGYNVYDLITDHATPRRSAYGEWLRDLGV